MFGSVSLFCQSLRSRSKAKVKSSRCHFSTGAEWSKVVLGFAKYSKMSNETQIRYTLKKIIECASQGAFKIVVYVICWCFGRLGRLGV